MHVYRCKGKVKDVCAYIVKAYWKVELQLHAIKTLKLHGGEWST